MWVTRKGAVRARVGRLVYDIDGQRLENAGIHFRERRGLHAEVNVLGDHVRIGRSGDGGSAFDDHRCCRPGRGAARPRTGG